MAAFGASAVTASILKGRKAIVAGTNAVNAIVFSFVIPASSTVAGPIDIAGITFAPGSVLLGGVVSPSQSLGSTTLAFVAGSVTFSAATAYTAEAAITNSVPVMVASSATANSQLKVTTAAATSPSTDTTVTVTLFIGTFGKDAPRAEVSGN